MLIDEVIEVFKAGNWDYLSNSADEKQLSVPDGFDIEVFSAEVMMRAACEATLPSEREHVTPWFRSDKADIHWGNYNHKQIHPYYRVTVDDKVDLEVIREIVSELEPNNPNFGVRDVVEYLKRKPNLANLNINTVRNEGFLKSQKEDLNQRRLLAMKNNKGQKLWGKAKKLIPGGNMLLSRERKYIYRQWPTYFSRARDAGYGI